MIGGIDIQLPSRAGDSGVQVAVRAIREKWPQAAFENAVTGDRYDSFWQVPFAEVEEIFVYRDAASADAWDAHGAVPAVYNTMIHLIADEDMVTVVVDERNAEMEDIIGAISSALTMIPPYSDTSGSSKSAADRSSRGSTP